MEKIMQLFEEDPIKILRIIRMAVSLNWKIEKKTWFAMVICSKYIGAAKQERVTDEINKMLLSATPSKAIDMMLKCNVLDKVLPVIVESRHIYQDLRPRRTLYEHILECLDKTPPVLETRLAALFHDIGKIKTYDKNFIFHQLQSANMAEEIMKAMKYSNAVISTVKLAIENHEDFSSYRGSSIPRPQVIRKFVAKFDENEDALDVALDLIHANNISQTFGKRITQVKGIREKIAELEKKNESGKKLKIPIDGNAIMKEFNLRPSPVLGKIMTELKNKVIENPNLSEADCFKIVEEYLKKVV